ncbi:MAG: hypothetical protein A2Y25_10255 [Candidatus Melainabacteria bacterium GWF2_37_15]|nr:MAG: hypothetical protein A2Y25_10255 [Candidatus Melainabacteria bacterium GWF2_37_15]
MFLYIWKKVRLGKFVQSSIDNSIGRLDTAAGQALFYSAGVLPPLRRVQSVPDRIKDKNYEGAALQVGVAGLNIFGDLRELELAAKEGADIFSKGVWPSVKNYKGQHAMKLLEGTVAEGLFEKVPFLSKLNDYDDVLYNTRFGKFLQRTLNLGIDEAKTDFIERAPTKIPFTNKEILPTNPFMNAYNFKGSYLQQLAGRALHRISKLGLITGIALEVPALIRSITDTKGSYGDKAKAFGKQLIKSSGFVGFTTAGIALAGAALAPTSLILGLVSMAAGSAIGIIASKEFNKQVDKIIS